MKGEEGSAADAAVSSYLWQPSAQRTGAVGRRVVLGRWHKGHNEALRKKEVTLAGYSTSTGYRCQHPILTISAHTQTAPGPASSVPALPNPTSNHTYLAFGACVQRRQFSHFV